jgi:DNA repair protein RecO (recombination protein O)|tara:strand:- start:9888 stop:10580 length:693 start_codon:yes stop_codon:yes gene_type:complete
LRESNIEGFVLHARDYRDTSQLVDIFTQDFGRVRLVARGSRSHKKNSLRLSPFCKAEFSWTGRGELKTLTNFETARSYQLKGEHLISGFYINELLWHLLLPEDSHPGLYRHYSESLAALNSEAQLEPLLRSFELNLLGEVGYGISFDHDFEGNSIDTTLHYNFSSDLGWHPINAAESRSLTGGQILAIAQGDFSDNAVRNACKYINRVAIDEMLDGKKLNSRELIAQTRG